MCHSPPTRLQLSTPEDALWRSWGCEVGMSSSKPLESLLPSILRAVLAGQPFSHHLIVLDHS
jgi:hypothetical protein